MAKKGSTKPVIKSDEGHRAGVQAEVNKAATPNKSKASKELSPKDIDALGITTVLETKTQKVQATKPGTNEPLSGDLGPIMTTKEVQVAKRIASPDLGVEEAALLPFENWREFGDDRYTQAAVGVAGPRRFIIDKEVYEELCQNQEA